jgi:hypothetical protein
VKIRFASLRPVSRVSGDNKVSRVRTEIGRRKREKRETKKREIEKEREKREKEELPSERASPPSVPSRGCWGKAFESVLLGLRLVGLVTTVGEVAQ